jgi:hypothetical protein
MFNIVQITKELTRVTETTASVIDHILCNNTEKICQSGVLNIGLINIWGKKNHFSHLASVPLDINTFLSYDLTDLTLTVLCLLKKTLWQFSC